MEYVVLSARFLNCTLLRPFVRGVDPVPSHPIPSLRRAVALRVFDALLEASEDADLDVRDLASTWTPKVYT